MAAALLRVKRKRGADPAEALILSCKRLRREEEEDPGEGEPVTQQVFRLAATVSSQNEPLQKYVREALSRDKASQALRPSLGSSQRIQQDLRASKEAERQDSRYRLITSLRPKCETLEDIVPGDGQTGNPTSDQSSTEATGGPETSIGGNFQLFDIVQEGPEKTSDTLEDNAPETILCNSVKMIRERLTVSEAGLGTEHRESAEEFVYDIYYSEASSQGWIQDILSVQRYTEEQELVPEDDHEPEIYEDEDDENEESNWRNDYPDEEDSDREERFLGYYEDSEEEGEVRGHAWRAFQQRALREFQDDEADSD